MFQLHEKQKSPKKHITKLNLNLQLVNLNPLNNVNSNPNKINLLKQSISNTKQSNFFSPKIQEKKYAFDYLVSKNPRFQSTWNKSSGSEFFLKLKIKGEKNKNVACNEEYKNPPNNESKLAKPDASTYVNFDKFIKTQDQSIKNTIEEDTNIIYPEEIYNMSIVKLHFNYLFK